MLCYSGEKHLMLSVRLKKKLQFSVVFSKTKQIDYHTDFCKITTLLVSQKIRKYKNPKFSFSFFCVLHVFPRLASVSYFPALGISYMFSRAWHRFHVFPPLAPVTRFPALGIGFIFSRTWHRLCIFPLLASVSYFPALGPSYNTCFPALGPS